MKDETYTLLIWQLIPESTSFYLIPNEEVSEHRDHFTDAHGRFLNSDAETDGMRFVASAISSKEDDDIQYAYEEFEEHIGKYAQYIQCSDSPITNKHITHVYMTGFLL